MLGFNKGNRLAWLSTALEKLGIASEAGNFDVILNCENLSDNEADCTGTGYLTNGKHRDYTG